MTTIPVKGIVVPNNLKDVYDFLGYEAVSPKDISEALNNAGGSDVTLEINSPGGYVDAGSEIYTDLKKYQGNITAQVVGQACSAASWIALAADSVEMSPTATMMIHRASTQASGNTDDLSSALNSLDSLDRSFVDLYSERTGLDKQEVYRMMNETTWMNAQDAVDKGFADKIMFQNDSSSAIINAYGVPVLSDKAIANIKNSLRQGKSTENVVKPDLKQPNNLNNSQLQEKMSILFRKDMN